MANAPPNQEHQAFLEAAPVYLCDGVCVYVHETVKRLQTL